MFIKNKIRKILEFFQIHIHRLYISYSIVSFCTFCLFIYCTVNVVQIFHKYLLFESIVGLEDDPPNRTHIPGITVCAPSIFRPEILSELYPESFGIHYRTFKHRIELLSSQNAFQEIEHSRIQNYLLFSKHESLALEHFNASYISSKLSVQLEDLLVDCRYRPLNSHSSYKNLFSLNHPHDDPDQNRVDRGKKCLDICQVLPSIYQGQKCFTFFSKMIEYKKEPKNKSKACDEHCRVLKGSKDQLIYDLNPSIVLHLKSLESDIWSAYIKDSIQVAIHPRKVLPNRADFRYISIRSGNLYEVKFTQSNTYLLPPPYDTMCIRYGKEDKFLDLNIKSQDNCLSRCVNLYLQTPIGKRCNSNYYTFVLESMFLNSSSNANAEQMRICNHTNQDYTDYMNARDYCLAECPPDCRNIMYDVAGDVTRIVKQNCDSDSSHLQMIKYWNLFGLDNTGQFSNETIEEDSSSSKSPSNSTPKSSSNSSSSSSHCNPRVLFRIAKKPFTTVRHQKAISWEKLLGTIGGHVGIWLGLSLYKFGQILLHILYILVRKTLNRLFVH